MTDLLQDLDRLDAFARELADAARAETLSRWQGGWIADDKSGGGSYDPVTEAEPPPAIDAPAEIDPAAPVGAEVEVTPQP